MDYGSIINFGSVKNFTYIKPLGDGGTGDTHLFKDETTDTLFAIKKYLPKAKDKTEEYYVRFVDEIKILFNIYHPNIVRIYNYYLYPQFKTGYLQMEYIKGTSIDKHVVFPWTKSWEDLFAEAISAFEYLEDNNILHRDIRPANILIDENDNLKIIDFGFSKKTDEYSGDNSIILNWPATEFPEEVVKNYDYDEQTEIYFLGYLFKRIIANQDDEFSYMHIIDKMTKINPTERYLSFHEIMKDIREGVLTETEFSVSEKNTYIEFADSISSHINYHIDKYSPISDISSSLSTLSTLIRKSALEEYIQDNSDLIACFITNGYNYSKRKNIKVKTVTDFYSMLINLPEYKKKIIFDNLFNRLSSIDVKIDDDEELPF